MVSVRSTACVRLTQPFSTPIGYAVNAKPTDATLANGRDGKRSGVRPLVSLVVSQKNWKVRRSMSRNNGDSSGRSGFAGVAGAVFGAGAGFTATGASGASLHPATSASSAPRPAYPTCLNQDLFTESSLCNRLHQ